MTDFVASSDIVKDGGSANQVAIQYVAANDKWTIEKGVLVASTGNTGVLSAFVNNKLVNHGTIVSGNHMGVQFQQGLGVITNGKTGDIIGFQSGIWIGWTGGGASTTVTNLGSITGLRFNGVLFTFDGGGVLINKGEISGHASGVHTSTTAAVRIENSGKIGSDQIGIHIVNGTSQTIVVENARKGVIDAPVAIASLNSGKLSLDNKGKILGRIDLDAGQADTIVNKAGGTIKGKVELGPGNDTFVFAGGKQGKVFGEAGADRFDFRTKLVTGKDAAKIGDMTPGTDTIGLSKKLFGDIGPKGEALKKKYFQVGKKADDANDRIIYDKASGKLFFDPDGNGSKGQKLFAQLDKNLNLKVSDFEVIA